MASAPSSDDAQISLMSATALHAALSSPEPPLLLEACHGSNRSATVTIAVCMDLLDLTLAEAWALVCERRKAAAPLADNRAVSAAFL